MNREIEKKIEILKSDIDAYWRTLEVESIWLFLAAIGCWGVDTYWHQFTAFSITFFLFVHRVLQKHANFKPFSKRIKAIQNEINSKLEGEAKKERVVALDLITSKISLIPIMKSNCVFLVCFIYTCLSFLHVAS